jgi:Ricin-type beta-trefoil lectin domain
MKHQYLQRTRTLALLGAFVVAGTAVSHSQSTTTGEIYNSLTNKCLQPANGSNTEGAVIVLETCDKSPAQQWKKVHTTGSNEHYVNQFSGMCMDARGGAANSTPVQQWPCNQITNENWLYKQVSGAPEPEVESLISGTTGFCLDVPGGQGPNGTAVQIYGCNGTASQQWFTP